MFAMRRTKLFGCLAAARAALSTLVLPSSPLPYRGLLVDLERNQFASPEFSAALGPSLEKWRSEGHQSVMLRLELADAALAAAAAEHGFEFHHAEGQKCVLKCWLPPTEDKVPPWATHQVGGCGFVLNDKGELLVIKEWRFDDNGVRQPSAQWKMPGGMLNKGESFADGICREVLEETGVQTRFVSLLTFWHRHGVSTNFAAAEGGKSDMYFCARLEPVTDEIRLQEDEISACEWQDLRAFCRENDHPLINAVARRLYGVGGDADEGAAPLRPVRELVETDEVRWPSRPAAYPAYFPF